MVWPFSQNKETANVKSSKKAEVELMKELPDDLASFFQFKNRERFDFKENERDPDFERHKQANPVKSIPLNNCADFQLAIMDCLSNGSQVEKLGMCREQSDQFQNCIKFQKSLLTKLGLEAVRTVDKYDKIERGADELGLKWLGRVKDAETFPEDVLNDIYDKRDEIWK